MLPYSSTPVQELMDPALEKAKVRLLIKREDLNHPTVAGNKWWKLKYNLEAAVNTSHKTVLTFGGAYSNHIYATAAATFALGLNSIGLIRGEQTLPLNPTLQFAADHGMNIHYVSRVNYRKKTSENFINELHHSFESFYLIPEGGSNLLAVKGCAEFAQTELKKIEYDYLYLPVGTGGTMAGIIAGLKGKKQIKGISVLKDGTFLNDEVETLVKNFSSTSYGNWAVLTSYDHGGYAKVPPTLSDFIAMMKARHNLPLDPLYTGKLMWAVMKEIASGMIPAGSTVLALHTGGLQNSLS